MDNVVAATIIGGFFGVATAIINKGWFSPKQVEYDSDALIDSHISALGHKYGCQRITILGYHNGGFWADGTSIKKLTMRHEYHNQTQTTSLFPLFQNVSTGILKELPSLLYRQGLVFECDIIESADKIIRKPDYYKVMQEYGTTATVAVAIKRKLFNWRKFKTETVMVGSVHFNWSKENNGWTKSFIKSERDRLPFCTDINLLLLMFDKKHIKHDTLILMEKAINQVT
jgi:hypothetical protein